MKVCSKCGAEKSLSEFHRNKNSRDGRVTMCKSCVKAYQAEWRDRPEVQAHMAEYRAEHYRRNRDAIRAQQAKYRGRADVKARKAEYNAEYRRQNRDAILAQEAEYRARPEVQARVAEYNAEYNPRYYTENRDAILARQAEYRQANPHQKWVDVYRRRAKKFGFEPVIERFTRDDLIAKYGSNCWHCGGPFEELDHAVIPVALGGHHTLENCRPSCTPCNAKGRGIRRTNTNETENTK